MLLESRLGLFPRSSWDPLGVGAGLPKILGFGVILEPVLSLVAVSLPGHDQVGSGASGHGALRFLYLPGSIWIAGGWAWRACLCSGSECGF